MLTAFFAEQEPSFATRAEAKLWKHSLRTETVGHEGVTMLSEGRIAQRFEFCGPCLVFDEIRLSCF